MSMHPYHFINNLQTKRSSYHMNGGYTLVELMVSLSLFIIIVIALIGSLYTVNDASRKVQAMRTVMDNLNFAMETMSRTIRTSEKIGCPIAEVDCPISVSTGSNDAITMESTLGQPSVVNYRWVPKNGNENGRIEKQSAPITIVSGVRTIGQYTNWISITAPEIDIEKLDFYVEGSSTTDQIQPHVIIKLEGVAMVVGSTTVPFAVQTYLSQRTVE